MRISVVDSAGQACRRVTQMLSGFGLARTPHVRRLMGLSTDYEV